MGFFNKNFPARLHSTKEVLQFLKRVGSIKSQLFSPYLNYMYGDLLHPIVKEKSFRFLEKEASALSGVKNFVMEISTRKYCELDTGDILCAFYYNQPQIVQLMEADEIKIDILEIKSILKRKFNIENLYIIPHLDLTLPDGSHIEERRKLRTALEIICKQTEVIFLDVSKAFAGKSFDAAFYDATHYSEEGSKTVFSWLKQSIQPVCEVENFKRTEVLNTSMSNRASWIMALEKVILSRLSLLATPGKLKDSMPIEGNGEPKKMQSSAHLEFVARSLCGAAPFLEIADGSASEDYLADIHFGLESITNDNSPDYLNFKDGYQPLVDAAFLALGLLRSPSRLWGELTPNIRSQVITALKCSRTIRPHFNNWLLFSAMIETFLFFAGEDYDKMRIDYALRQHEQWHLGDGHYGDGVQFRADYYNSYVILPFLLQITQTLKGQFKDWDNIGDKVLQRAKRYAEIQERMISADGTFPPIGRSIAYRGGAFHLLAQLALMKQLPESLSPAQVRCALWAVIEKTLMNPTNYDEKEWLKIGLNGHQPSLGENYISTGSLYLTSVIFLPLGLPESDEFWTAPDELWTQRKIWWFGHDIPADKAY